MAGGITILAIFGWLGLCCAVAGSLYLLSLCLRGDFADEPFSDDPHRDSRTDALVRDLELRAIHSAPLATGAQQDHV